MVVARQYITNKKVALITQHCKNKVYETEKFRLTFPC